MRAGEAFCFSSVRLRKRVTGGYRLRAAHHDTTRSFLFGWLGSTCRRMRSRMADGRRVRAKPVRIVPLRRSRRSRPRPAHRPRRISNCGLRRAGSLCGGHARGADGGHGPGSRACLGRRCQLRRQTVARSGGYRPWRLSVPAFLHRRTQARRQRPKASLAPRRTDRARGRAALLLL
jgi:hypothetical protein